MAHSRVGAPARILVAILLGAAAALTATPAAADQTDDDFVAALVGQGIPVPDANAAVQEGRIMCTLLDQGTTRPLLVLRLMRDTNLSARQAGFFLGISTAAYCPQYRVTVSE
ncbi:hypothetical protein A5696_06050 [Mycobacterium sp. E2699]|uniref:DUF732 domain-containing protein n=1 Tax=Mycobacterium sp. E2699 TaxID=1834137 RepID=UPI0007FCEEDC|nr:DUF732 domain-containing protein [Mycobacterium sp. E2699]OBH04212.1 hypothetical protein A5696_06050 [Mycobacterium sp. E2699]